MTTETLSTIRDTGREASPPYGRRCYWQAISTSRYAGILGHVVTESHGRSLVFSGFWEMPFRHAIRDIEDGLFPHSLNQQFRLNHVWRHLQREVDGSQFPVYAITRYGNQKFHESLPVTASEIDEIKARRRFGPNCSKVVVTGFPVGVDLPSFAEKPC